MDEAANHDRVGCSWAAARYMLHRYNPIGGTALLQRRRRRQWRCLLVTLLISCGIAIASMLFLPRTTRTNKAQQIPDPPPNGTCSCGWEWLEASPARVCASDSEHGAWVRCTDMFGTLGAPSETEREVADRSRDNPKGASSAWRCICGTVRSVLVGPFRSRVQEWHSITITAPLLHRGDRIVRFTGGAVHAHDAATTIGYPPLHVHHLHVHHGHESHFFESHGDYLPASAAQPPVYSLASPPARTCIVQDDDAPMELDAQINDVRFSTGTAMAGEVHAGGESESATAARAFTSLDTLRKAAQPIAWYLRIVFDLEQPEESGRRDRRITGQAAAVLPPLPLPCTPVYKLLLFYPLDDHALADPLMRFDAGNRETLFTWTLTLPMAGRLAPPAWLHAHRARYGGYLLLRGAPTLADLLGLQHGSSSHGALDRLRDSLPPSNRTATVRAILIERAARDGRLLCYDDPAEATFIALSGSEGDGLGGHFDRQGRIVCEPFAFSEGEVLTAVYLSRPVWAKDLLRFPQHAQLAFFYTTPPSDDEAAAPGSGDDAGVAKGGGAGGAAPLIRVAYAESQVVADLDGTLEGARSLRCVQPSAWAVRLRLGVWLSSHVVLGWIPFLGNTQPTCEEYS